MRKPHITGVTTPLLALFIFLTGLSSCSKSELTVTDSPSDEKINQLKQFLSNTMGITPDKISFSESNFIIDKDGLISLSEAESHQAAYLENALTGSANAVQQRKYYYSITPTKAAAIKIYVDPSVPASWVAALNTAIANWNATNSKISMSIAGSSRKANVIVNTTNNTSGNIATGYYPTSVGDPGKYVTINTYYNSMSDTYKVFALTHELGHVCGFTHTDGTYGNIIAGTPDLDANSVMNSFVLPWSGFTSYDLTAIRTIYPR